MSKSQNRESKRESKSHPGQPPSAGGAPSPASPASRPSVLALILHWFLSRTVRQATAMRKHVQKLLNHQRDILSPQAVEALQTAIGDLRQAVASKADKPALEKQMEKLETSANKWLKPYPNAAWRENVEVLLVALAVAMGIRTFFLQPFKIPTGSMQPTLYGVTSDNLLTEPGTKIPTGLTRIRQWFAGVSYLHLVAENDGPLQAVEPPVKFLIFNIKQTLWVGGKPYTIWFPPDYGAEPLQDRAGLRPEEEFHAGQDIVKLRISAGDHLFVDRLTYNFRPPERGEVIVFETKGIEGLPQDQFYIKRLVGLGDETLSLHQDYEIAGVPNATNLTRTNMAPGPDLVPVGNLVVNGRPITASTPRFENLYSFYGASSHSKVLPYKKNHYYGHAMIGNLAPGHGFHVPPNEFFVMGDNTMNSLDSRYWGGFPQTHVIGKAFFVYWPFTDRFGWGYH